ncbi:signal peptide peptidase SppA [SAR86 cluster bacterium]|nr:signal peptide peptidase SppA [SAR86 cluster bacterium]
MNALKSVFNFLGRFLTSTRIVVTNLITFIFLALVFIGLISVFIPNDRSIDKEGKVVILNPEGVLVDQEVQYSDFQFSFGQVEQIQTRDLIKLIQSISKDEDIPAVLVDFSGLSYSGPTNLIEISEEIQKLSELKRVIAFSDRYTTSSYLIAAHADEIYIHQAGGFDIQGIGGYRSYNKSLYENLKMKVYNYSQGDYKSAVEGLTRDSMSDFDKKQRKALYDPIWSKYKEIIAQARGISKEKVQKFADSYFDAIGEAAFDNIEAGIEQNYLTGVKSFPEFRSYMIDEFGKDESSDRETYNYITYEEYSSSMKEDKEKSENIISVITAEGAIVEGEISQGFAGSAGIARQIRKAHEDDKTKAIVFRVNSPGGSIIASEIIRDELLQAKNKGKKVVVSMGDYAASGGVYISTPADYIFAHPTTITGSIGVAIAFLTTEDSLDYIGISKDGVQTSEFAGWTPELPVTEELDNIFNNLAERSYQRFLEVVSESRKKDVSEINKIAGGRVWIGTDALRIDIIDELGDIEDAIGKAATLAEISEYQLKYSSSDVSFVETVLSEIFGKLSLPLEKIKFVEASESIYKFLTELAPFNKPSASMICKVCIIETS